VRRGEIEGKKKRTLNLEGRKKVNDLKEDEEIGGRAAQGDLIKPLTVRIINGY